ncbi:MAG: DUF1592 domain-containing protein [Planctomycetota bacterium]
MTVFACAIGWISVAGACALSVFAPRPSGAAASEDRFAAEAAPFLARYCAACHTGANLQGGLDLGVVQRDDEVRGARADWDWLRERVLAREMPPRGEPAPTDAERDAFLAWLTPLVGADAGVSAAELDPASPRPDGATLDVAAPGRPALRRLTRRAYANAVRDLFGVDYAAQRLFPSDPIGYGFEGVGEAQSLSDAEVELFLEAAEAVASRAILVDAPGQRDGAALVRRIGPEQMHGAGVAAGDLWSLYVSGVAGAEVPLPRPGRYRVRARVFGQQAGDEPVRLTLLVGDQESAAMDVPEGEDAPRLVEAELDLADLDVTTGRARAGVRFVNDFWDPNEPDPARRDRNLGVQWIEVVGPLDATPETPFYLELCAAAQGERGRGKLRAALGAMARRVWRRPPEPRELGRLERLTDDQTPFAERLRVALVALLASPRFIFFFEDLHGDEPSDRSSAQGTADAADAAQPAEPFNPVKPVKGAPLAAPRRLSDFELAARLAFTLWASVPDRELDALADAGHLSDPDVLQGQIARMLADERALAYVDTFGLPWLHLGPLANWTVDEARFPDFDRELRRAMLGETRRVLVEHLRQARPLSDLLDGTRSIVDARLAAHYGVPFDPALGRWQEVDVGAVGRRGLLGHASVLTVTSEPTRTSPVKRGKWVLDVLLGSPPPPPPPGVSSLDNGAGADTSLPLRERLALHRTDPNCAACHSRMDPLGFGLEGFDAIGRGREVGPGDDQGELPDGRRFAGAAELVAILRAEDRFARQVTERLFVHALGRPLARSDRAHVDAALEAAASAGAGLTLRGLVEAVLMSRAFGWIDAR